MEIKQLEYFMVTAKYEHITKASKYLHIAQPALSQSIRRLEDEMGVALFDRKGRNIVLNDAGTLMFQRLSGVFDVLSKLPEELKEASHIVDHTIKLNILSASELMTDIIIKYKAKHPEVVFQISQKEDAEQWDIKISSAPFMANHNKDCFAIKEEVFLAVPLDSPFASSEEIDLFDVKNQPFISLSKAKPFRNICDDFCESIGFTPDVVFESDNPAAVKGLIRAGLGVAFWPIFAWGMPESDQVKVVHISRPSCIRDIIIIPKEKKSFSKEKNDFYEFILESFKNQLF